MACGRVKIILFFYLFGILNCPLILYSQSLQDTIQGKEVQIDEIVITSSRAGVTFSRTLRSIEVSTSGDMRLSVTGEPSGVLELIPGVDIRQRGAPGQQADISIRGGTFDQTLILINGVNISDPQTGHHNMDLPFDLDVVDRIELLRGPGARIFGPNAFNGVVNVIVKEPTGNRIRASVTGGSHNYTNASLSLSLAGEKISDLFSASHTSSDGYITNTDFVNTSFFNRFKFRRGKTGFDLQTGYYSRDFGANSFYSAKYPSQYEKTHTCFGSLKATFTEKIEPVFYWRRHYDCFELFRDDPPSWYTGHNYHMTDVAGSAFNYEIKEGINLTTSIGYSFRYERILSNKLGHDLKAHKEIPRTNGLEYTRGDSRLNAGVMIEQSYFGKSWRISGGLLANFSDAQKSGITIYPGVDAGVSLTDHLSLYATLNRTLRQPTFTDLYYNDPTSKGNPDLKPEEAFAMEAGVKYRKNYLISEISIFRRNGKNMIDWVRADDNEIWQVMNLTSVNISGAEISFEFDFQQSGNSFLNYLRAGYTHLCADKTSEGYQSKYLLDILKNKIDIVLSHKIYKNLTANWSLTWQDRAGGYTAYTNGVADRIETPFRNVFLADGRITYQLQGAAVFLSATNITGIRYFDIGGVQEPGRWLRAGIIIKDIL
ncbi:MAG TPA: TonB-dependent receptor [Bacteroidales bacterium]|nr:TonB-dependent receptor [Bacteroidales bacterium]